MFHASFKIDAKGSPTMENKSDFLAWCKTKPNSIICGPLDDPKKPMSKKQRGAWWGVVIPIYMQCIGHTNKDVAHYELVTEIDPLVTIDIKGREHVGPTPTKNKNTKESMELYRKAQDFIAIEYDIEVPEPNPNWKGFNPG